MANYFKQQHGTDPPPFDVNAIGLWTPEGIDFDLLVNPNDAMKASGIYPEQWAAMTASALTTLSLTDPTPEETKQIADFQTTLNGWLSLGLEREKLNSTPDGVDRMKRVTLAIQMGLTLNQISTYNPEIKTIL